jgi:hypothetical protein
MHARSRARPLCVRANLPLAVGRLTSGGGWAGGAMWQRGRHRVVGWLSRVVVAERDEWVQRRDVAAGVSPRRQTVGAAVPS